MRAEIVRWERKPFDMVKQGEILCVLKVFDPRYPQGMHEREREREREY